MTSNRDRAIGALVGLAVGDAVGTTLEFKRPGSFTPITDMVGGGPFGLEAGAWTDDTSMAMCLAEPILDRGALDPVGELRRYVAGSARQKAPLEPPGDEFRCAERRYGTWPM